MSRNNNRGNNQQGGYDEENPYLAGQSTSWEKHETSTNGANRADPPLPPKRRHHFNPNSLEEQKIPLLGGSAGGSQGGPPRSPDSTKISRNNMTSGSYGAILPTTPTDKMKKVSCIVGGGNEGILPRSSRPSHRRVQSLDERHSFLRSGPSLILKESATLVEEESSPKQTSNSLPQDVIDLASAFTSAGLHQKHRRQYSGGLPPFSPSKASTAFSSSVPKKENHRRTTSESGLLSSSPGGPKKYTIPRSPSRHRLLPMDTSIESPIGSVSFDEDLTRIQELPFDHSKPSSRTRTHSRNDSLTSVGSVASAMSVRSDITKSAFYQGVSESGHVQFFLPLDNVRLVMDPNLHAGVLCKTLIEDEMYDESNHLPFLPLDLGVSTEDSHQQQKGGFPPMTASPMSQNQEHPLLRSPATPKRRAKSQQQQHVVSNPTACHCSCKFCTSCHQKNVPLPHNHYLLTVDHDLYKRVISEIADSRNTPCGLFFCGHHEDVSRPSICIALGLVSIVLGVMFACTLVWAFD